MSRSLPVSLLAALAWGALVGAGAIPNPIDPTITAAPQVKRQDNSQAAFIGYLSLGPGEYESQACNSGLTWSQSGSFGQCCETSSSTCYFATSCFVRTGMGYLVYPVNPTSTASIACSSAYDLTDSVCVTGTIFANPSDNSPKTDIVCANTGGALSYYRTTPSSSSTAASTSSSSIVSSSVAPAPTPITPKSKSKSKAWIAGPVIGGLVALALILGLILFFLRKNKNKKNAAASGPAPGVAEVQPPQPQPYASEAKPTFTNVSPQPTPGYAGQPAAGQELYPQQPQDSQKFGYQQQAASPPMSPAPQYSAPYNAPGSPPSSQQAPQQHAQVGQPLAAELGGSSQQIPGGVSGQGHTAELSGESGAR